MTLGQKVKVSAFLILGVVGAYLILAASMGAITNIVSSANASLHASANMTDFPGVAEAVNGFPWYVWFIPGVIGVAGEVWLLRFVPTV